ncbi:UNVERIFIED_CONTAM: hypothetical protein Sradi_0718600 [Sesamum radiatum]|uniref:RNase H type-1 domain-containing protein n=1 Tax=Sesamum radiatum TaxID=300843 RepID=A0AAW2VP80_SESRA
MTQLKLNSNGNKGSQPLEIDPVAIQRLQEFKECSSCLTPNNDPETASTCWEAPARGFVKINSDGAIINETKEIGAAVIARNELGSCLAWKSCRFPHSDDPLLAESKAALMAINLALEFNWHNVIFEEDCKNFIERLLSVVEDNSSSGPLVNDARQLMNSFATCQVKFIGRALNFHAHVLARLAGHMADGSGVFPFDCSIGVLLSKNKKNLVS